ncbi:sodium-dependent transporter [Pyramidobacter sp. SM-530-WT-4B]|uniref:Sodium-dependent transporter n=1 Tax=Pyramidobacter porci TaxID=2605789 RepID=A0A6L5YFZ0_9BACT|nr:sodium-dependent transporter [Pyramidobacter porci]MCI6260582.1 sodium-dependent transporter [Pyramidobacter sp.]MDY2648278.1 sodium-dependent transporter [Pyramidobacter porci]MST56552.1 sodium-dependent transporter [Pyramidobacter porci]
MERESFKSRIGFILVSAGCAIGIGNVWKYPWLVGQNGGGIFVLFYLLFLICMGIPVLTMELAVGRASRKSAVKGYETLEPAGSKWHVHGWFCVAGNYLLMMYYTTVSGWMLSYFFKFTFGTFDGMAAEKVNGVFGGMLGNPEEMALCMALTVIGGFLVCSMGMQKGLEKVTKWMMLGLLALIVVLAVHSLLLPGAGEGARFYLLPSVTRMKASGLGNVIMAAMNQSFFTLSLGIASMEIFGSYMSDQFTLTGEAVRIVALDTFVAFMAGLIIFPACFSFGVQPDAGPSLIFLTLPKVFINMEAGRLWGSLFFLFMTFASFSTVITVFENILAACMDNFGWSRTKSVWFNCAFVLVTSVPCVLGYNLWSDVRILGSRDVLDSEDFVVSNLLLPLGSLIYLLFCVTKWGWGFDKYLAECNKGAGIKMSRRFKPYFQFVLPLLILAILIQGLM